MRLRCFFLEERTEKRNSRCWREPLGAQKAYLEAVSAVGEGKMRCAFLVLLAVASVAARGEYDMKANTLRNSGAWCKTCNVLVSLVDNIMNNQEVQHFLDEYLEQHVCPLLPVSAQAECVKDIPKFLPMLISFLESLAGAQVCSGMGVCDPHDLQDLFLREQATLNAMDVNSQTCEMCHQFAQQLEDQIISVDPETFSQYKTQFEQACTQLPESDLQAKCKEFVDQYSYLLMYYVMKEKSEGRILRMCEDLHVCSASMFHARVPALHLRLVAKMGEFWLGVNEADSCERCKEIAKRATGGIISPDFKAEVNAYLENLCSYAPPIKESCTESLTAMADKFLDFMAANLQPEAFCAEAGFCGDGSVSDKMRYALSMKTHAPRVLYAS